MVFVDMPPYRITKINLPINYNKLRDMLEIPIIKNK